MEGWRRVARVATRGRLADDGGILWVLIHYAKQTQHIAFFGAQNISLTRSYLICMFRNMYIVNDQAAGGK